MIRGLTTAVMLALIVFVHSFARAESAAEASLTTQMSAQERAAFAALREKVGPTGRAAIDLTDPSQRQAYYALLRTHGITNVNRPELFEQFDRLIAEGKHAKASGLPVQLDDCKLPTESSGSTAEPAALGSFREILDFDGTSDFKTVSARAIDTVSETPVYVLDSLDVYDEGWQKVLSSGTDEGFTRAAVPECKDGKCLDPHLQLFQTEKKDGNNPTGGPVNVFASFYYRTATASHSPCLLMLPYAVHFLPASMTLEHPTVQYGDDPRRPIIVCINRENKTKEYPEPCDYGPIMPKVGNDKAHVRLYAVGSVTYNDPLPPIVKDETSQPETNIEGELTVIPPAHGGACPIVPITHEALLSHFALSADRKTLSFHWAPPPRDQLGNPGDPADFGKLCWQQVANNSLWDFVMVIRARTLNTEGKPTYPVYAAFRSKAPPLPAEVNVPQIRFQYGCVARGTPITMADGTLKPIEQVKIGDSVASPRGPLKVQGVTTGTDTQFVQIMVPGAKQALYATETHPIAIDWGKATFGGATQLIEAGGLAETKVAGTGSPMQVLREARGDEVPRPESVVATRVSTAAQAVYNLTLEQEDGKPVMRPEDALFYANGIVVGDNAAQGELERKKREAAAKWPDYPMSGLERVDFANWSRERHLAPAAAAAARETR